MNLHDVTIEAVDTRPYLVPIVVPLLATIDIQVPIMCLYLSDANSPLYFHHDVHGDDDSVEYDMCNLAEYEYEANSSPVAPALSSMHTLTAWHT